MLDIKTMVRRAEKAGWRVVKGGKHLRVYPADKTKPPLTIPISPSDRRATKAVRADLRRAGLDLPPGE